MRKHAPLALAMAVLGAVLLAFSTPSSAIVYPSDPGRLWPGGVVPYEWGPDISGLNKLRVGVAMQIWRDVANVDFVPRDGEDDYVFIRDAPPNSNGGASGSSSPAIGRGGGRQNLNIRIDLSNISDHGLAHELGHVLGLYHTMQRTDRDDFLQYFPERTIESGQGNFAVAGSSLAWPRDAMDYDSLLSYGRCTFAGCAANTGTQCLNNTAAELDSCRTLLILHPTPRAEFGRAMGQRSYLTRIDRIGMALLYPEPDWRIVEPGAVNPFLFYVGTMHNPFPTFEYALTFTPEGGTLWMQPEDYSPPSGRLDKAMTLRAPLGRVTLRDQ